MYVEGTAEAALAGATKTRGIVGNGGLLDAVRAEFSGPRLEARAPAVVIR